MDLTQSTNLRKLSVKIRVSEQELAALKSLKTRYHLATWMREKCLSDKGVKQRQSINKNVVVAIARVGNSVNQIARALNALSLYNISLSDELLSQFDSTLSDIRYELKKLTKSAQ